MSKTPLVDSLGVFVEHAGMPGAYVSASDLEACLEKLPKVQGAQLEGHGWCMCENAPVENATHTARLMCIQEIKSEPVKVEFEAIVTSHLAGINAMIKRSELIPFIGKYVRVTVEEIEG